MAHPLRQSSQQHASEQMTRFFISAGETSGDFHAATVVSELKLRFPNANISGIAGSQMQQQGCIPIHHMHELNVMGISDVLRSLSRIRMIEKSILTHCCEQKPDVAILVDFSSFHMRLGRKLRQQGIPVIHFIAPKLWAWGSWRVKKLQKSQDKLACILPFEVEWFQQHGIKHIEYVGNPSAIACQHGWSATEIKQRLHINTTQSLLALLPGSRPQEIKTHVPILADVLKKLQQHQPDLVCVIPIAPGIAMTDLDPLWHLGAIPIERTLEGYAMRADAAVAVSGTATLELALWNTPTILIYKAAPLMAFLARHLFKLGNVGLANIILDDQPVMPELLQDDCQPDKIIAQLLPLIRNEAPAQQQREAFIPLQRVLGQNRPASGVVDMVESLLKDAE